MENQRIHTLSASSGLLIEQCDDGSLVFNLDTGATTLLDDKASVLLRSLLSLGEVAESELRSHMNQLWSETSDFSAIFASLENSQLVFRC